ncbi:MAG: chlorophyll A-B binding protein [cyanobacterium endosymbiont of Rhopalodia yunnanensis]
MNNSFKLLLTMTNSNQYERKFGFVAYSETLNVCLAMIDFVAVFITELVTGQEFLHF